jgi:uncharacterized repeat protein (TIGR01451 family)/fimbrial isopeptide formation D2 family protein
MRGLTLSALKKSCVCVLLCLLGYEVQAQETFLDQFGTAAYNNTNGTQSWSSNSWTETGDGATGAGSGLIRITGNALRVGSASAVTAANVSIQRTANLSSFSSGTLSFSISQTGVDNTNDSMVVEASSDGTTFTTLATFTDTGAATPSYDLTPYLSANTTIRFRIDNALETNEYFTIDNVQISLPSANLGVTKTGTASVTVNGSVTYTMQVTNAGPSNVTGFTFNDVVPQYVTVSSWACSATGTADCDTTAGGTGATGTTNTISLTNAQINSGAGNALNFTVTGIATTPGSITNTARVTLPTGTADLVTTNNSASQATTINALTLTPPTLTTVTAAPICAVPGVTGDSTLSGVINTYYGSASANQTVNINATSVQLGASRGAGTPIAAGDLILLMQMQDATINTSNTRNYGGNNGSGTSYTNLGNTGLYEYVVATNSVPLAGGTLTFRGAGASPNFGTVNAYTNATPSPTQGQRTFQVIRVPQYANATISGTLQAVKWDGTSGGVVVVDVAGTLTWGGSVDVRLSGFRAGYAPAGLASGISSGTVYRCNAKINCGAGKGEGVAGTPANLWDGTTTVTTGSGYPDGTTFGADYGMGAPANGGGGGGFHNAGGGGGSNGGAGGKGGLGWEGESTTNDGGEPGVPLPPAINRLFMGGGGGGGDANNATSLVRGGVGAGIVIVRAGRMTGTGTIEADGDNGDKGVYDSAPDGAGGGGAGGSVLLYAKNSSSATINVNVRGGAGGNTEQDLNNEHGPGGGGGGGLVVSNVPGGTVNTNLTGGLSGRADNGVGITHAAQGGTTGFALTFATTNDPFATGNGSTCGPQLSVAKTTSTATRSSSDITGTYTITVSNAANRGTARGVAITDDLPAPFTYAGAAITPVYAGGATGPASITGTGTDPVTFGTAGGTATNSFTIPAGGSVAVTFNINLNTPGVGTYQNPATVSYSDPTSATGIVSPGGTDSLGQSVPGANYASASGTAEDIVVSNAVAGYKSVRLSRDTDGSSSITPGDLLIWTVQYRNSTASAISNFQITDTLPANVTISSTGAQTITVSGTGTSATANTAYTGLAGANTLLATGAALGVGGVIRVDIPVIVNAGFSGALSNQASGGTNVLTDNVDNTTTGLPSGITVPAGSIAQTQTISLSPTTVTVNASSAGLPFACDATFYQTRIVGTTGSQFSRIFRIDRSVTPYTQTAIGNAPNLVINGMGYNAVDNYLYAIHLGDEGLTITGTTSALALYRIGQTGFESLGPITGLPTGFQPTAADFDNAGNFYVTRAAGSNELYKINVVTRIATLTTITATPNLGDMSFNPIDNFLYAVNNSPQELYKINPSSGAWTKISITGVTSGEGSWGATFFDKAGNFYAYGNEGSFYTINLTTGVATRLNTTDGAARSDGAACVFPPPQVDVVKAAATPVVVNATTADVTYTVIVGNRGTTTASNVQVTENLGLTFSAGAPTIAITAGPTVSSGSCTANNSATGLPQFDGVDNSNAGELALLEGTDTLAASASCTITFTARITYPSAAAVPTTNQNNTVYASSSRITNKGHTFPATGVVLPPPDLLAFDTSTNGSSLPASANGDTASVTPVSFLGSISGTLYLDNNNNASFDGTPTDTRLGANISVELVNSSNAVVATQQTDASGNYIFSSITPGTYTVRVVTTDPDLGSATPSAPASAQLTSLTSAPLTALTNRNFGFRQLLIGLAKALDRIVHSNNATDNVYTLVYRLTVENFSSGALSSLAIFDDVATQFSGLSPTNYNTWVAVPANAALLSPAATLTRSGTWNGTASSNILTTGQSLAANATGIVYISFDVTVNPAAVSPNNQLRDNTATVQGTTPSSAVITDTSTAGTDPDGTDNDNNPDENTVTPAPFVKLVKEVRNCGSSLSSCSGTFGVSATGKPGEYLEYRIRYYNISSQAITQLRVNDTLAASTPFQEDTYAVVSPNVADFNVTCPNASTLDLDRSNAAITTTPASGAITGFNMNIMAATACNLTQVTPGQQGQVLFKVKIP